MATRKPSTTRSKTQAPAADKTQEAQAPRELEECYCFPAIRGVQAGKEYYACMVPIPIACKIFLFDEEELPVEQRTQRELNKNRARKIAEYVESNIDSYVLPSLTASIDSQTVRFNPATEAGVKSRVGELVVPMTARLVLNDGQHRRAGLKMAIEQCPSLAEEHVSVTFFVDPGLERCQQIFADINRNASPVNEDLTITFDHRDPIAILTRSIGKRVPLLQRFVRADGKPSGTSIKLLAKTWVYNLNDRVCTQLATGNKEDFLVHLWKALSACIPEWEALIEDRITAESIRKAYISGHAVTLKAIEEIAVAVASNPKLQAAPEELLKFFEPLKRVDWHKSNPEWLERIVTPDTKGGLTMLTKATHSKWLAIYLKGKLGIKISNTEKEVLERTRI